MHRFIRAATTAAIMLATACAFAFVPPSTALDKTPSGRYALDASHTSVLFNLSHLGFSHYFGRFNTVEGTLEFNAAAPEKSTLAVTIDVASIDTNNAELEGKLKGPEWFDAQKFPKATFTSTSIEKLSDTKGKLTGNLTLHGITKPVVLDVTFNGAGTNPFSAEQALGFSAQGDIKRSDFGIAAYLPAVGDVVTLTIETEFHYKK